MEGASDGHVEKGSGPMFTTEEVHCPVGSSHGSFPIWPSLKCSEPLETCLSHCSIAVSNVTLT